MKLFTLGFASGFAFIMCIGNAYLGNAWWATSYGILFTMNVIFAYNAKAP